MHSSRTSSSRARSKPSSSKPSSSKPSSKSHSSKPSSSSKQVSSKPSSSSKSLSSKPSSSSKSLSSKPSSRFPTPKPSSSKTPPPLPSRKSPAPSKSSSSKPPPLPSRKSPAPSKHSSSRPTPKPSFSKPPSAKSPIPKTAPFRPPIPTKPLPSPLEQIKAETKAAHRSPHLRKGNRALPDQIDSLDDIIPGGIYHHEGPYDAALASRNRDARYAPLAAVKEGNKAALRATPAVHIIDSLTKHVPLQGTATVPNGERDYSGNVMSYEEGADVMREADAGGGPYRRYEHVDYLPDDLKGKGEPSYTIERDLKKGKTTRESSKRVHGKKAR